MCKQAQINKDFIRENTTRIDNNYRVRDKVMKKMNPAYKYKTPFKGTYVIFQTWTNNTVILQDGVVTMKINIHNSNPMTIHT